MHIDMPEINAIETVMENYEYVRLFEDIGRVWAVRVVLRGGKYGRDLCLTHDKSDPLVEFYNRMNMVDPLTIVFEDTQNENKYGQFAGRYYLSTILKHDPEADFNIDDSMSGFISGITMPLVIEWLRAVSEAELNGVTLDEYILAGRSVPAPRSKTKL